jgi:hypothetical protein
MCSISRSNGVDKRAVQRMRPGGGFERSRCAKDGGLDRTCGVGGTRAVTREVRVRDRERLSVAGEVGSSPRLLPS